MLPLLADIWDNTTIYSHITPPSVSNYHSKISFTWILMDVLLDFPPDVLERTTPSLPAFCLPITSLVQLAGEVVWISHRRGLGMPRHRKTRLLHWPAYRLLFLIRVLDWKQIVSHRERGVVPFHLQDFFLTLLQLPRLLISGCLNFELKWMGNPIHFSITATNKPFSHLRSSPALFLHWGKSSSRTFFFFQASRFFFLWASLHFSPLLLFHVVSPSPTKIGLPLPTLVPH